VQQNLTVKPSVHEEVAKLKLKSECATVIVLATQYQLTTETLSSHIANAVALLRVNLQYSELTAVRVHQQQRDIITTVD
jgi:hypothetical protein